MLRMTHSSSAWRGDLGEQLGDPQPALAAPPELPGRAHQLRPGDAARAIRRLAVSAEGASACSRTYRRARGPRSCRGRSRAGHGPGNAGPFARAASPPARAGRHRRQAGEGQVAEPGGDALQQVATRETRGGFIGSVLQLDGVWHCAQIHGSGTRRRRRAPGKTPTGLARPGRTPLDVACGEIAEEGRVRGPAPRPSAAVRRRADTPGRLDVARRPAMARTRSARASACRITNGPFRK